MKDLFFKYKNELKPEKGRLLISEPYLPDPNFERTVVLICEHDEEGSFGFVLNKLAPFTFNEVVEGFDSFKEPVYVGGPVQQDTLHYIYKNNKYLEGGVEIANNLYWGGNYEQLKILIDNNQVDAKDFRFFVGYSGWGKGQLEDEIKMNSWIVSEGLASNLLLETSAEDLWKVVLKNMGGRFEMFSKYPVDPRLN